jgi:glycosyltransferase involved in cell wall biosynthesis
MVLPATNVNLFVNSYKEVNGLGRYADALHRALREIPGIQASLHVVKTPEYPLMRSIKRFGIDPIAFLNTYPITWPEVPKGILHLTHRSQSTLLLRKPPQPVIITVHDIIHYQYRNDPNIRVYRHKIHEWGDDFSIRLLFRADAIVTNSEYTRQTLIDHLKMSPDKVFCTLFGLDHARFRVVTVDDDFYQRHRLDRNRRYLMHISTEEPRKNFSALLRAFARIHARYPDVHLLKVGRPLYANARIQHLALAEALKVGDAIRFVDDVRDDDLVKFYNLVHAMVLPSFVEGFGFPVLEAMACGTPVICSTGGSLPEVAADAALLFDPRDEDALVAAMERVLEDSAFAESLAQRGLAHAAAFTWARTARQTVEVYRKVLEGVQVEKTQ